jgi:hypothetical protein
LPTALLLDAQGLRAASDAPHHVQVLGDSADLVNLAGSWTNDGEVVTGFTRYSAGGLSVDIDSDVQVWTAGGVNLAALDGADGFRIDGVANVDQSGIAVSSAGDVNGDGFDDLVVGAFGADPHGLSSGAAYVVFGAAGGFSSTLALSSLNGDNGFRLDGVNAADATGGAVSGIGDINRDGFDDVLVGSRAGDSSYVVFGKASGFAANLDASSLNGSNGFALSGPADSYAGFDVRAAGDINGDGFADLVIGAYGDDANGTDSGSAFVVFGKAGGFAADLNLAGLNGSTGFRINGAAGDDAGLSVSGAGDINGDGFDDLMVGALFADPNGNHSGSTFVVFGKSTFSASIDSSSLTGLSGFVIDGAAVDDRAGRSVSNAGDVNGDGFDDMLIGAVGADPNGSDSGATYVVFGTSASFGAGIDLSTLDQDVSKGFAIEGGAASDFSSIAVSAAGDVNGDGYDDILIGARGADVNGNESGSTYLLFGKASGFDAHINLDTLTGATGLRLNGVAAYDFSGIAVAGAGDIDGDGYDDLIIGASQADPVGAAQGGSSYVLFGRDFTGSTDVQGSSAVDSLTGTGADEVMVGGQGDDTLDGAGGEDVLKGGAGDDTLVWDAELHQVDGGSGVDTLRIDGSGITLDLTTVADFRVGGIERIDMTGSGNNVVTLNVHDVLALPDHGGAFVAGQTLQLLLDGNAGDTVHASGQGWVQGSNVLVDGSSYASYTVTGSAAQLLVDLEVTRDIS